jgi:hypothetical protein
LSAGRSRSKGGVGEGFLPVMRGVQELHSYRAIDIEMGFSLEWP